MLRDIHTHLQNDMPMDDVIEYFGSFKNTVGIEKINFLSIPCHCEAPLTQNLRVLTAKKAMYPYAFAFFGFYTGENHKDFLTQVKENTEMGFDGLKILESKPDIQKKLNIRMCDEMFDEAYSYLEENGIPVLMHVADPETSWDSKKIDKWALEHGRCYEGKGFLSREDLYGDVEEILRKHPKLKLTLAHFYFMSEELPRADEFLTRHPNVSFDITPGKEMFLSFTANHEKSREFFIKYADRIYLGTDVNDNGANSFKYHLSLYHLTRDMAESKTEFMLWGNKHKPLDLPKDVCAKIFRENFINLLGNDPKEVNINAARKHIEYLKTLPLTENDTVNIKSAEKYIK